MHPIGQHVLAGFDGFAVTPEVRDLILKDKVLGFTLFKWNIQDAAQLRALTDELKSLARQAGYALLLAVDQEGGRVERLPEPFSKIPAMRKWTQACGTDDASQRHFFELGRLLGKEVRLAGFNLDFAPVVDVDSNPDNPIIGDRSFSNDPLQVYTCAKAVIRGLIHEGVIPCLKHFPGHGATVVDSHLELPCDARSKADILDVDVVPFAKLISEHLAPTLMTAHVLYPNLDPRQPATLSHRIIKTVLRDELGYDGVVFSDDFLMKAIADNYDLTAAAKTFYLAGGDAVLVCKKPEVSREMIAKLGKLAAKTPELSGALTQSLTRIENLKREHLPELHGEEPIAAVTAAHRSFLSRVFAA